MVRIPRAATHCASQLQALADPTRLHVLRQLMKGPKTVAEVQDSMKIEASLLSHHLRSLREARLVEASREGRLIRYRLHRNVSTGLRVGREELDLGCCRLVFDRADS